MLVSGRISDVVGRKPVLLGALIALIVGLGIFLIADSIEMLLLARTIHGAAVGSIVVAAAAALLDLRPHHGVRSGQLSGVSFNIGMTVAIVGSSLLAQYVAAPAAHPVCGGRGGVRRRRRRRAGLEGNPRRPHRWAHPYQQTCGAAGDPGRLLVRGAGRDGVLVGARACCCRCIRRWPPQQTHMHNLVFGGGGGRRDGVLRGAWRSWWPLDCRPGARR